MAPTNSERIERLETDQTEMKAQLTTANAQLAEITATLADLSRKISKLAVGHTEKDSPESEVGPELPEPPHGMLNPLQLPGFNGSDPIGWLARANQQFEIHGTSADKKVPLAVVAMEESALYWVTWFRSRKPGLSWEEFSKALISRFDTRFKGGPFERLADVKQTGSVEEYINLFVQLAGQVPGLTDEHYLGYFMKGLSDSVRGALRLLRPRDLETAMELARDVEDNLALQSGGRASNGVVSAHNRVNSYARPTIYTNSGSGSTPGNRGSSGVSYGAEQTPSSAPGQNANRPRFTRLSPNDYADLRAKGLCYRCKKPYTPGHECPLKQLRVLLAEEDEVLDFSHVEGMEIAGPNDPPNSNEEPEGGDGSLSLCSMAGISGPRTMRLCGVVRGRTVTVLIDSGASHNFISAALVPMLKLNPDRTSKFGVQLGDGRRQESEGVCREVCVSLPGCEVVADCYVFALGGVDIILGVAWLATLGDVRINWETMTMKFVWKRTSVELRGDPTLCRGAVGLKAQQQMVKYAGLKEQQMVKYANRRRRLVEFEVGDRVFLKVRPFRQTSVSGQRHLKLAAKFYGPFVMESRVGPTAYRLTLQASSRIHPVFHVSQLRWVVGEHPVEGELPESLALPVSPVFEPETVLAWRNVQQHGQDVEQVLVQWVGQSSDDATWLGVEEFRRQFPDFNLGDKVVSKGEGVDREQSGTGAEALEEASPGPLIVYRRRGRA